VLLPNNVGVLYTIAMRFLGSIASFANIQQNKKRQASSLPLLV
jgi:hypothetical protein